MTMSKAGLPNYLPLHPTLPHLTAPSLAQETSTSCLLCQQPFHVLAEWTGPLGWGYRPSKAARLLGPEESVEDPLVRSLALLTFGVANSSLLGAVLCFVGCSAAYLASIH